MTPEAWRAAMRDWALPEAILARAPESPWGFPVELFRSRMERAATGTLTFSNRRARDALPPDGTVLDIGVGAGAASLPLHPRCSLIVGVNSSADSLAEFQRQAAHIGAPVRTMQGELAGACESCAGSRCRGVQPRRIQRGRPRAVRHRHDLSCATARRHGVDRATSDRVDGRPLVALPRPGSSPQAGCERRGLAAARARAPGPPSPRALQARAHGGFARREDAVAGFDAGSVSTPSRDAEVAERAGRPVAIRGRVLVGLRRGRAGCHPVVGRARDCRLIGFTAGCRAAAGVG